jgi:hypothetical protein
MATTFIMSKSCDAMVKCGLKTFSFNMKVKGSNLHTSTEWTSLTILVC